MRTLLALTVLSAAVLAQDVTITTDKDLLLSDFLDMVSRETGQVIIYDPNNQRIRGQKLGASFQMTVPKAQALSTFRSILAFFELTMVRVGPQGYEIYLVIDSRSTNSFVKNRAIYVEPQDLAKYADRDGVYISYAVRIRHIKSLTTLRTALSTMVTQAGIGRVHEVPGSNSIILVDYAPTVAAMAKLIAQMDVPVEGTKREYHVIELKHAKATELSRAINAVLAEEVAADASKARRGYITVPARVKPRVVPYTPRNALLVSCNAEDAQHMRQLVAHLDLPAKREVLAD